MNGFILLADGTRLDGTLAGAPKTAMGWLAANTAVVGFQEMATDPTYKARLLVFTYPEIGNVGVTKAFSESPRIQAAGLVVKVLSEYRSHYLSEDSLDSLMKREDVPCLVGIDTRGLAVIIRDRGEMPAAITPADADAAALQKALAALERPRFKPTNGPAAPGAGSGKTVAVINLGIRRSTLQQLALCCSPQLLPYDANEQNVLASKPSGLFISDGPGGAAPPEQTVATIRQLVGKIPILAAGLGHVALGIALGCRPAFLKRGHHGANYPVRSLADGRVEITEQRHSVMLERESLTGNAAVALLMENLNDSTVEGIRTPDGLAVGLQATLAAAQPGAINPHIKQFIDRLS